MIVYTTGTAYAGDWGDPIYTYPKPAGEEWVFVIEKPYPTQEYEEKEEDLMYYTWKAEMIREPVGLSRGPILPAFFFLVFMRLYLIRRKVLRCNRHGVGLHMGRYQK